MSKVIIEYKDQSFASITTEPSIRRELKEHFTYEVPNSKWHPQVRAGLWDGRMSLYGAKSEIYLGLVPRVEDFCKTHGYEIVVTKKMDEIFNDHSVSGAEFFEWTQGLNITSDGERIYPRDYQLALAYKALRYKRGIFKSATATGKSLAQYLICRHLMDVTKIEGKILLLVPTTNLVEQMYTDFADYSAQDDTFFAYPSMSKIYYGKDKSYTKKIVVSTWQSLQKIGKGPDAFPAEWFEQFDAIIVDETHTAEAKEIKRILELCTNTRYRIGVSGTIKQDALSLATLEGLIGPLTVIQTTKQAMDAGHIAQLNLKGIVLDYRHRKEIPDVSDYHDEIDFIVSDEARNNFIANLAVSLQGNTLIFFNLVDKHGRPLYERIKKLVDGSRNVYIVDGGVDVDDREVIRQIIERETNAIILVSYGTSQMGTNYKNVHNGIFAAFSKSMVRVLQSIGRGLRKTKTKSEFNLFDLADNIDGKNASYRHLKERKEIYSEEGFEMKVIKVNL